MELHLPSLFPLRFIVIMYHVQSGRSISHLWWEIGTKIRFILVKRQQTLEYLGLEIWCSKIFLLPIYLIIFSVYNVILFHLFLKLSSPALTPGTSVFLIDWQVFDICYKYLPPMPLLRKSVEMWNCVASPLFIQIVNVRCHVICRFCCCCCCGDGNEYFIIKLFHFVFFVCLHRKGTNRTTGGGSFFLPHEMDLFVMQQVTNVSKRGWGRGGTGRIKGCMDFF